MEGRSKGKSDIMDISLWYKDNQKWREFCKDFTYCDMCTVVKIAIINVLNP